MTFQAQDRHSSLLLKSFPKIKKLFSIVKSFSIFGNLFTILNSLNMERKVCTPRLHPFCLFENDAIVIFSFCRFVSLLRFRSYSHAAHRFYLLKRFPFIYKTQSHQETLVALCKDYNALTCQQTENKAIRLQQELESFFCFTSYKCNFPHAQPSHLRIFSLHPHRCWWYRSQSLAACQTLPVPALKHYD